MDSGLKLEMMRRIGFDHLIDYTKEDFTNTGRNWPAWVTGRVVSAMRSGRVGRQRP